MGSRRGSTDAAKPGLFNLKYREYEDEPRRLSGGKAILVFCCNPVTRRYVCRPIIRPWLSIFMIFVLFLTLLTISLVTRYGEGEYVLCQIEYPSFDRTMTFADRKMMRIDFPWVRFPDSDNCDADVDNDCYRRDIVTIGPGNCQGINHKTFKLEGPVNISIVLAPFYQMHRRYVLSRDYVQLRGDYDINKSNTVLCEPLVTLADLKDQYEFLKDGTPPPGYPSIDDLSEHHENVLLYPCGLQAFSFLNDTFVITDMEGQEIDISTEPEDICAKVDIDYYKECVDDIPVDEKGKKLIYKWMPKFLYDESSGQGVENSHFMNWMRLSPYKNAKKLFARVTPDTDGLTLPIKVVLKNRFNVRPFLGHKYIQLTSGTRLSPELSLSYLLLSLGCLLMVVVFGFKLKLKPRRLGDIRYIR